MAITVEQPGLHEEYREDRRAGEWVMGGTLSEAIAAIVAIALSIIGLASTMPVIMASIAVLAIAIGLLFQGGAIAAKFSTLLAETSHGTLDAAEFGEGISAELIGGVLGIILGILSLLNVVPGILLPVAVMVFGATLILGTGLYVRLNSMRILEATENERARRMAREIVTATSGVQILIGVVAIILGILGVIGLQPVVLSLAAFIALGFSAFLSSTAITSRMFSSFHRPVNP